jgi:hypothetical protein
MSVVGCLLIIVHFGAPAASGWCGDLLERLGLLWHVKLERNLLARQLVANLGKEMHP